MKRIVVALSLALCMAQAPAVEGWGKGRVWIFEEVEIAYCLEGGGCVPITVKKLNELQKAARCGFKES